jgi:hypothetical protein
MEVFNERDTTREIFDTVDGTDLRCRTPEFAGISVFIVNQLVITISSVENVHLFMQICMNRQWLMNN